MELFKESFEKYRSILDQQVKTLDQLEQIGPAGRDDVWRAKHDYAAALARDVLKLVLPTDSAIYGLYTNAMTASQDSAAAYERQLYKTALESFDWSSDSKGTLPFTPSAHSEVSRALPEIIYKHWTFKVIIAALVAVVLFAATGVLKFYSITLNIKQEILDKETALTNELDRQKKDIDTFQKTQKAEADEISNHLSTLNASLTDSTKQLAQLDIEAQGTLARFTAQASRKIDDEVAKAVDTTKGALAQRQKSAANSIDEYWTREAQPSLKKAAETRVTEILADGWKPFQDKLREFDIRLIKASETLSKLESAQKALDGKQLLLNKAMSLLANPSPGIVERLSTYIGQALWVIYGGAILMLIMMFGIVIALVKGMHLSFRKN
jgi:hypothetical protein